MSVSKQNDPNHTAHGLHKINSKGLVTHKDVLKIYATIQTENTLK